jgi:hypothetical protein
MSKLYVRPYVSGAVTAVGWSVVCVPEMRAVEVVEPLASRLAHLVATGKVREAQTLLCWFGGEYEGRPNGQARDEPLPI